MILKRVVHVLLFAVAVHSQTLTKYVDPFIGTAGDHGQLDPAACVPFGMVKLGPDTQPLNHSGYNYDAKEILGFSHNRLPGVGCRGAGGLVRIRPGIGPIDASGAAYIKESETATVGYYSVRFASGIKAEMTATNQIGLHRYTFPLADKAYLFINLKSSFSQLIGCEYNVTADQEICGRISARNNCDVGVFTQYFSILADKKFSNVQETDAGIFLLFSTGPEEIINLEVTLSPISIEQARMDRSSELGERSFDRVRRDAVAAWEKTLSCVEVEGKEEYKTLFYTHLYHSLLSPVNSTSSSGTYKGTDRNVYAVRDYIHYDSWSIWDTFRTKFPLITLLQPAIMRDICISLADLYRTGKEPWASNAEPVPTCRTEHSLIVLLDAYRKGVPFDVKVLYPHLQKEAETWPLKSPDNILETSYDFWGLAEFAAILGKTADHETYFRRSRMYQEIWRDKFQVMGENADIMHGDGLYEGTLWQYHWFVPYDLPGLIEICGGADKFTNDLSYFFENDLYNHGNQPDIQAPYWFVFSQKPWLTQKWVHAILTQPIVNHYGTHVKWEKPYIGRVYKNSPDAFIPEMDDDDGTMSAWYVLSSMGLYPYCAGKTDYAITAPLFEKITLHLGNGVQFVMACENMSDENYYIKSMSLNGQPLRRYTIAHDQILQGGTLKFIMDKIPNQLLGR